MNNPYNHLEKYVNQEMEYAEFCNILKLEPTTGVNKSRQLKIFEPYMELDVKRNRLIISKLYGEDEMLLVKRNANFTEYFENLLIVHLSQCEGNVAKFTYSEVEQLFFMVNSNYIKTKYNKRDYITSQDLKKNYNKLDFEDYEIIYDINKNLNLFFDISDRTLRRVISNALKSMQSKSLILVNNSFRLFREEYDRDKKEHRVVKFDCNPEQVNELLDIRNRLMNKFNIKTDKDLFFMTRDVKEQFYNELNQEIRSNELLEYADRYSTLFIVNLGKEGLKIEADKIDKGSNEKMLNTNVQYKLLTTKELMCVNDWLKKKLVEDTIG